MPLPTQITELKTQALPPVNNRNWGSSSRQNQAFTALSQMLSRLGFKQPLVNITRMIMKKIFLIAGAAAALVLAGCNQGGTSDQYGTSGGSGTSSNSLQNGSSGSSSSGANGGAANSSGGGGGAGSHAGGAGGTGAGGQ
jgi:hypothetical protein